MNAHKGGENFNKQLNELYLLIQTLYMQPGTYSIHNLLYFRDKTHNMKQTATKMNCQNYEIHFFSTFPSTLSLLFHHQSQANKAMTIVKYKK